MLSTGVIANRVLGEYPLSIATSLAIEGATGNHPDHPTGKNELIQYNQIWVNIKTIFRNLYNAVDRELVLTVKPEDLYEQVEMELDQFQRVIAAETKGQVSVVFYVSDYADMERTYPHAHLRGDTTPLQKAYTSSMISALTPYIRNHQHDLKTFKLNISGSGNDKTLLLTHYAIDLFAKGFRELALLESHTGAVKLKHQWYTKYLNGSTIPQIPFMNGFMQVFGDKEHFRPWGMSARKTILNLADEYLWSQVTTKEKVIYSINTLKDHLLRDVLKEIL